MEGRGVMCPWESVGWKVAGSTGPVWGLITIAVVLKLVESPIPSPLRAAALVLPMKSVPPVAAT